MVCLKFGVIDLVNVPYFSSVLCYLKVTGSNYLSLFIQQSKQ